MKRAGVFFRVGAGIGLGLISGACVSNSGNGWVAAVPDPPAGVALATGWSTNDFAVAKDLCLAKCVRCHRFYDPAGYGQDEWDLWMKKMSRKAKLNPDQATLLARYLDLYRR